MEAYREHSLKEMQRVIGIARELKQLFTDSEADDCDNIGGFSAHGFLRPPSVPTFWAAGNCLAALDSDGVEIIAQTMPPYPWHFGGQSYNVFVDPDEIRDFGRRTTSVCLDVSH